MVEKCEALGKLRSKQTEVSAADIADVTAAAMAASASALVCEAYCTGISNVRSHAENRSAWGAGAITAVLAMEAHLTSLAVQGAACDALRKLTEIAGCTEFMRAESDGRAAVLLKKAKAAYPDDNSIQHNANGALLWLEEPEASARQRFACIVFCLRLWMVCLCV